MDRFGLVEGWLVNSVICKNLLEREIYGDIFLINYIFDKVSIV